jgi:hypothetical protein
VNTHPTQDDCAWCALPKAKRGLVAGMVASIAAHLTLVGAVLYLGQTSSETKPRRWIPMIAMGSIIFHRLHQRGASPQSQEL